MITAAIPAVQLKPVRDLSVDYLRTTLTLMVLAHHSCLAYTSFPGGPIVDSTKSTFFDYAENFNDVFFMSLMFFVSGLFVYPALRKHGTVTFIRDRVLRLGLPFAVAVTVFMPIAYYAAWQLDPRNTGFLDFYQRLAHRGFEVGPPWFVWVLLLFDVVLALALLPLHRLMPAAGRFMVKLQTRPIATFALIFLLAAALYLPLLNRYGFGTWTVLVTPPFAFQICRIGLYALWFVFGVFVGIPSYSRGLLSRDGSLARHPRPWMAFCFLAYNALVFIPRLPITHRLPAFSQGALEAVLWVISCVASSFAFLALFRGINLTPRAWMISLSRSAYIMYLVHYVFVTWTQRIVLDRPIPVAIKFLFVFLATTLFSWLTAQALLRIPILNTIL